MKPYNNSKDKKPQVEQMFDNIATRYDLLNKLLSLGIDKIWRLQLVKKLTNSPSAKILDIACGTADLSIMIKRKRPQATVYGCDLSQNMVDVGKKKIAQKNLNIELFTADAENLPLESNTYDAVTCSFGVRNFANLEQGIAEMHRILKPQGQILILEFSKPHNSLFAALFKFYFHKILPTIGGWISGDKKAYTYLPLSVDEFACGEQFLNKLRTAGFDNASLRPLTFAVATLYTATKK